MIVHASQPIRTDDFDFDIPPGLIAVSPRPHSEHRLLAFDRAAGKATRHTFDEIVDILPPRSLIVVNNSQVMKTSLALEADPNLDLQVLNPKSLPLDGVVALCPYPAPVGETVPVTGGQFIVTGIPVAGRNIRRGRFTVRGEAVHTLPEYLEKYAAIALPRYVASQRVPSGVDANAFQTMFARLSGSLTCPTAGLHFTPALVAALRSAGHEFLEITLHIGFGSWGSLETEFVADFDLDAEQILVDVEALRRLREAKRSGQRILAVGTTTVRTLESVAGEVLAAEEPKSGTERFTSLLIYPGHEFKVADMLLTDFAYPRTPVMMMSAAFTGLDALRGIYREAIPAEYQFDIFGDGLLIL